ncbi:MAG: FAD binding domain-containing protein [Chloroflexi bacterium]|nr:FAD binding domain-containing protein [Chloroflexota bacterium]
MPSLLPPFSIDQPTTLDEASRLLAATPDDARAYAGGTELLLVMKHGGLRYERLVDVKTIPGLDRIEERDGALWIGALATHRAIETSPLVRDRLPVLAEMEARVANPRVRATGTLGGNLCFAEPHSDPGTLLLCLEARLHLVGPDGERSVPMDEFVVGPYETALGEGELLRAIELPILGSSWRADYRKFQTRERPMLGLALALDLDQTAGEVRAARVAVGSVSPIPVRGPGAEALLVGAVSEAAGRLGQAGDALADAADLLDDLDGSAEYKRHLIQILLGQAFARLTPVPTIGRGAP